MRLPDICDHKRVRAEFKDVFHHALKVYRALLDERSRLKLSVEDREPAALRLVRPGAGLDAAEVYFPHLRGRGDIHGERAAGFDAIACVS